MAERNTERKPMLVVMQVVDAEGNPMLIKKDQIKIISVVKKLEIELYDQLQATPGAVLVKI